MKKNKKNFRANARRVSQGPGNSVPNPARAKRLSILNLAVFKNLYVSIRKRINILIRFDLRSFRMEIKALL